MTLFSYGFCQYKRDYAHNIVLVSFDKTTITPSGHILKGIKQVCGTCRIKLGDNVRSISLGSKVLGVKLEQLVCCENKRKLAQCFVKFGTMFPFSISNIFFINPKIVDERYRDTLNVVVEPKGLYTTAYIAWASKHDKSLFHSWRIGDRGKFWQPTITRLLLELCYLNSHLRNVTIWIKTIRGVAHIDMFARTPIRIELISPKELIRIVQ